MYSFSLCFPDGTAHYYDFRYHPGSFEYIKDQMKRYKGIVVCHNVSFDYRHSHAVGIQLPLERMRDTCIQQTLIWEHENSYSLDWLSKRYCKYTMKKGEDLYRALAGEFGGRATRNMQILNMQYVKPDMLAWPLVEEYGVDDARACMELFQWQIAQIDQQGLGRINALEHRLLPHVVRAEMNGIRVDAARAQTAVVTVDAQIQAAQRSLDALAGFAVNVNAPEDVKRIFAPVYRDGRWWTRDREPLDETPSGQPSVAAPVLRTLGHPAAEKVLSLRSLIKTRDTFLMGNILEKEVNGRVYPSINQAKTERDVGTGTGRFSYSDPALQQIPSRNKEVARIVKAIFLPEEGHVWVDSDMSSFEVRTFAHHCNNPKVNALFAEDPEFDMHQYVADLTGLDRNQKAEGGPYAKALNLAMIYAQGKGATAEQMGLPWEWETFTPRGSTEEVTFKKAGPEAERLINIYHGNIPGIRELMDGCKARLLSRGYIFTPHGRHLHVPNKKLAYKGIALLCQATAGDYNKENWITVNETIADETTDGKMLLNTHDSYGMSLLEDDAERVMRLVKQRIEHEQPIPLRVPLVLEVNKPGANWYESASNERWM